MTDTTRTVVVAAVLALAVLTGAALAAPATTTTTDEQTNETASVSMPDQKLDGDAVTIESATLPDGGYAVVYTEAGAPIGHTDYLDAGDHENLTVSLNESVEQPQVLVVTLFQNNGSEAYDASADSVPYQTENGANVSDVSYVYFQERGATTTAAETDRTTARDTSFTTTAGTDGETTTDAEASDETTTTEPTDSSGGGVPGFTPITAVVALVAAALVGLRRR